MTRSLPFAILSAAALVSGGVAIAQTPAAHPSTATHTARTIKTTTGPATATTSTTRTRTATTGGRMVSAKTSTGKNVTYNCAKAGNANKKACKG